MPLLSNLAREIERISNEHGFNWDITDHYKLATALALIHSEVSEALEALRDGNTEEVAEELIDVIIRSLDLLARLNVNVDEKLLQKIQVNKNRPIKHGHKYF